jgi:hypothetical protein
MERTIAAVLNETISHSSGSKLERFNNSQSCDINVSSGLIVIFIYMFIIKSVRVY